MKTYGVFALGTRVVYLIADKIEVIDIRRVRHRKDVYE